MTEPEPAWIAGGQGLPPELQWSVTIDAPLVGLELARETGETVALDATGGLYVLDRHGRIVSLTRGFPDPAGLAWSDTGSGGAVLTGESTVSFLDRRLKVQWTIRLREMVIALALDPWGNYLAVTLANGQNVIFDRYQRRIGRFAVAHPLCFPRFLAGPARIVAAAEYGLLCCHRLDGTPVWKEKILSSMGDLSATGDGSAVYTAQHTYGIQIFDRDGEGRGSLLVEGTANRVSTSFLAKRLAVTTVERHLYWLDDEGELLWATELPDEVCRVHCDPLGAGFVCGFYSGRILRLQWGDPE